MSLQGRRNIRSIGEVGGQSRVSKAEGGWGWPWAPQWVAGTVLALRAHGLLGDQPGAHNSLEETKRPTACLSLLHGGDMLPTAA